MVNGTAPTTTPTNYQDLPTHVYRRTWRRRERTLGGGTVIVGRAGRMVMVLVLCGLMVLVTYRLRAAARRCGGAV
jgi:hypothetical protein